MDTEESRASVCKVLIFLGLAVICVERTGAFAGMGEDGTGGVMAFAVSAFFIALCTAIFPIPKS